MTLSCSVYFLSRPDADHKRTTHSACQVLAQLLKVCALLHATPRAPGVQALDLAMQVVLLTCTSIRELLAQVGMLLLAGSCGGAMLLPMLATLPCHIAWRASQTLYL